jgi:hypothetical protein
MLGTGKVKTCFLDVVIADSLHQLSKICRQGADAEIATAV